MRTIVTIALLAFVATSVVFLAVSEFTSEPAEPAAKAPQSDPGPAAPPAVLAYYFHGTARCPTCLRMEKWAQEAVEETFAAEIGAGSVRWIAVNYDQAANEHFVKDYALTASAVVLAREGSANPAARRTLTRIWELSRDEVSFKAYVADQVREILENGS